MNTKPSTEERLAQAIKADLNSRVLGMVEHAKDIMSPMTSDDAQMELFADADLAGLAAREAGPVKSNAAPGPAVGVKFDTGKPMFDCIDPVGLMELGKVAAFGAQQYGYNNWRAVPNGRSRYVNAGLRHVLRGLAGEYLDPESKTPHFVVAAWNFLAAAWFERRNQGL